MVKTDIEKLEKKLWDAADQLRANSELRAQDYSTPVLGLIFLKFADVKFYKTTQEWDKKRDPGKLDYQAKGVIYVPDKARYSTLLDKPEGAQIGKALNEAMEAIEKENDDLKGVLPKNYTKINDSILATLLKHFDSIPVDIEGDAFGKIYEYFLGKFAISEGQKGGEFFTPTSLVKLIVEITEPFKGRILDPACGSGGMFVQSANFVQRHHKSASTNLSIHGQERVDETVRLAKMNMAVHGLSGDIKQGNTYYNDLHESLGRFDYLMANPPFNVKGIDKERLKDDERFPFGLPSVDNGNYIWMQLFYSALNDSGRAGFVMANSAADARSSEKEIRKKIIKDNAIDVIVSISSNFFYTVTLPCTLWFFDKGKPKDREDKVLFIDAREIYKQVDRAHREFTSQQIEFLANIARMYRGEELEDFFDSSDLLEEHGFEDSEYKDKAGLCKVATIDEIKEQGWSLNPGRYVGVAIEEDNMTREEFKEKITELHNEFKELTDEAHDLEEKIKANFNKLDI